MMGGMISEKVQEISKKYLGREIEVRELRLIPYTISKSINNRMIDMDKVSFTETRILNEWAVEGLIAFDAENRLQISHKFWMFANEVQWEVYVVPEGKMVEKLYYCFTETNDHEGEEWDFYIILTEEQHAELKAELYKIDMYGEQFGLGNKLFTEVEVDNIIQNTGSGYMDYSNKCDSLTLDSISDINLEDIYKGGIATVFKGKA